jgi:hypothetical protein
MKVEVTAEFSNWGVRDGRASGYRVIIDQFRRTSLSIGLT